MWFGWDWGRQDRTAGCTCTRLSCTCPRWLAWVRLLICFRGDGIWSMGYSSSLTLDSTAWDLNPSMQAVGQTGSPPNRRHARARKGRGPNEIGEMFFAELLHSIRTYPEKCACP